MPGHFRVVEKAIREQHYLIHGQPSASISTQDGEEVWKI
jgi:hypothetical protein